LFYLVNFRIDILPPMYIEGVGLTNTKILLEYVIMAFELFTIIFFLKTYFETQYDYLIVLNCGLILSIFSEALFTLYVSVYDTYNLLGHIYKIVSYYIILYGIFKYNITTPYLELQKAENRIKLYANNLEKIVDKRTEELKKANEKLTKELDYARFVQQSLLPKKYLSFNGVSFTSRYIPCERLSGDFFGIFKMNKDNIGMYILDVSGHGVPAALLTVLSNNYFRNFHQDINLNVLDPAKILYSFYQEFNRHDFPDEMHIVTLLAVYNTESRELNYCSAGINCFPILIKGNGDYEFLDKSYGFPICRFIEYFKPEYRSYKLNLNPGDKIIFYTDGLIDVHKNMVIGEEELVKLLMDNYKKSGEELDEVIFNSISNGESNINDDITYFIMEVK